MAVAAVEVANGESWIFSAGIFFFPFLENQKEKKRFLFFALSIERVTISFAVRGSQFSLKPLHTSHRLLSLQRARRNKKAKTRRNPDFILTFLLLLSI